MDASTIGQYRIVETLGQGGMGIVFRARHLASERAVALKTVRLSAPRWLDSIRREIQALTRVRHPGVVRIIDHGVHEGRPWYAMDLLEGETLRQFGRRIWSPYLPFEGVSTPISLTEEVSGGPGLSTVDELSPISGSVWSGDMRIGLHGTVNAAAGELQSVMRLMRRVCASLAFMHGEGFINRDPKPENIVLVDGLPVIIDFGLTTHHPGGTGREELEAQHGVAGTVQYMSPEQVRGELVDARSDLYAIGCILYELVVGRPPFCGAPRAVMLQHLNTLPVAPSERIGEVPLGLEQLIMRLLEKQPNKRIGYADEVAAELAELSQDLPRLADYPPARSYLYRPNFVGREELVEDLLSTREQAADGSGALVLLGGESGSGKTRVAMELTRLRKQNMRLITSETAQLVTENEARVAPSPMHALRPLLLAIADECHAGGPEVTERLLGEQRGVLTLYEPLLARVPAHTQVETPLALSPEGARVRLFHALTDVIHRFAVDRPLVFVIDDLGWLDEVSLAFLCSLTAEFFATTPIFLLCTYRSEDMPDAVRAIAQLGHVRTVLLPRLGEGPVRAMVSDMLALPDPEPNFIEFVTREAEGNPFFVAEYLRAAVGERILYRDQQRTWQVRGQLRAERGAPMSLALPRSLRALIDRRLRSLSTAAQQVALAAAVLGREMDFSILLQVSALPEQTCIGAVDELLRRQVLEQTEAGRLRFVHDKLREETYHAGAASARRELHARAATTLEAQLPKGTAAASSWAKLGHHFAEAGYRAQAVDYLERAAEYALANSAQSDALSLYRRAIEHATLLEQEAGESHALRVQQLQERYGDLLALLGRRDDARAVYQPALQRAHGNAVLLARLHRKVGKTWETTHAHDEALQHYQLSSRYLTGAPETAPQDIRDEWIQVRLDQLWVHYWLGNVEPMNALSAELEPFLEIASPPQQARYFGALVKRNLRRDRYAVSEETFAFARSYLEICQRSAIKEELPVALFDYGLVLFFKGALAEAEDALTRALQGARKNGDAVAEARSLNYLTICARMNGQVELTEELAASSGAVASSVGMREYVAAALANQAWVELSRGEHDKAGTAARAALSIWGKLSLSFPLSWLALLPLVRALLAEQKLDLAIEHARALLGPGQYLLPGAASDTLRLAFAEFEQGLREPATAHLRRMLDELPQGYC